jgi:hypothetical protein
LIVTIGLTRTRYEVPLEEVAYLMASVRQMRSYDIERPKVEEFEEKLATGQLSPDEDWFRLDEEVIMYAASHWSLAE